MQLTNGAMKSSAPPPPMGSDMVIHEYNDKELETFDLSSFVISAVNKEKSTKTSAKDVRAQEVQKFLSEGTDLHKLGERYEVEVVERGHKSLYELLASIYSLAQRIDDSPLKDKIVDAIRIELKDNHSIKILTNSTPISAMVRYVIRSDKANASRYVKVLTVAREENITANELAAYITRRGGVSQIQETEAVYLTKKKGDKYTKERTALIREYFELVGVSSKEDFTYKGEVLRHKADKETDAETSSFCVFVAHYVGGEEYKMVNANDLGRSYEDNLVKFMGKEFPSDPYVFEVGLRNFKRQLSLDESQPKALREAMVRQLAIPMRNKRIDVIEMEKPTHDIEE